MNNVFTELNDRAKKDTIKHLFLKGISFEEDVKKSLVDNGFFVLTKIHFKNYASFGNVFKKTALSLELSGNTTGTQTYYSLGSSGVQTRKDKAMLVLKDSMMFSKIRKINGILTFPEYRLPSRLVRDKILEIEGKIKELEKQKEDFMKEVYDSLPLLKFDDLPLAFKEPKIEKQKEVLNQILEEVKG